ncbi:hypothetical protein [Spirulina subsalsa]|uniref:hypothetical protein n=1 Tax=Spirulina subsalsa TaxID=54311 RepID=UPI00031DBFE1|nr:hypothetical protein [Spirulina subsalsa]
MTDQCSFPNPEVTQKLLVNLRRSRLSIEAATLELENITMQLEQENRQKRLRRLQQTMGSDL